MLSPEQIDRLREAASNAVSCEQMTRVPAELTVAQWALESGWGQHQPGNNCFGIKAYEGAYGTQLLPTKEVLHGSPCDVEAEFATFRSLAECFERHALLICQGPPYATVWDDYVATQSLQALVYGIAPIYATDLHYATLLMQLIIMEAVQAAITEARNRLQAPKPPATMSA